MSQPMRTLLRTLAPGLGLLLAAAPGAVRAQDWPQWRGPDRDGKAAGFKAPETWPEKLTEAWKVEVGDGVATPSLAGDKLYVVARQGGDEVVRCLDAASGKEIWKDAYPAAAIRGPAGGFPGPRASPAIADGKVVAFGAQGTLSCYDAANGKLVWRHKELEGTIPRFATSSSPLLADGVCIAQLGDSDSGVVVAYELATGKEKWKSAGDGPCYGSPVLMTVDGKKVVIAPTERSVLALDIGDGTTLWRMAYSQGRYNAATPMVSGATLIVAGPERGVSARKLALRDGKIVAEEVWVNTDNSLQFNTPILRDGALFGLSSANSVFCLTASDGKTAWNAPLEAAATPAADGGQERERGGDQERGGGRRGRGGRGGRGGGGGGGYGSIVDAGSVLFALTPSGQLTVLAPAKDKLEKLASYKVATEKTYAYPVVAGKRIYIKDAESVTMFTLP